MSRVSRAEAEARGWVIVHERDEREILESATQGRTRTAPAEYLAEKPNPRGEGFIRESADTMGLLLERIASYEATQEQLAGSDPEQTVVRREDLPTDTDGFVVRSVVVPADPEDLSVDAPTVQITDAEWSRRDEHDAIYVDGEMQNRRGVTVDGESNDVDEIVDNREQLASNLEARRTAEEPVGPTVQIVTDTSSNVDSPGQSGGGVLRIREEQFEDGNASDFREALSSQKESDRVQAQQEQGFRAVAPDEAEQLAGSDVGLGERGDLGSEIPPIGHTAAFVEGERERAEDEEAQDALEGHGPTEQAAEEEQTARSEATEDAAKDARDTEGTAVADDEEHQAEARQAGIEAGLVEREDIAKEADDTEEVEATDAAVEHAKEKGVDLSKVKGTGKDGRVTASDVDAAASDKEE